MKTLYIIGGLPGSGKSTLAGRLSTGMGACPWFEADDFHLNAAGVYEWKPENVARAHQQCQQGVEGAMVAGHERVIVSNTFTRQWEREPYVALARKYGYRVVWLAVVTDLTDAELAVRNVHRVPEASIAKMRARWEEWTVGE